MAGEPGPLALAADFPAPTRAEWLGLVAAVLAKSGVTGDDPEDALSHTTYDGIRVNPLYTAEDAHDVDRDGLPGYPAFVRGATEDGATATGWDVRTRHADAHPVALNRAVRTDLETGATSLWLVIGDGGLAVEDLAAALRGVHLDLTPIALDAGAAVLPAAAALLDLAPPAIRGSFGADPIGLRAKTGADTSLGPLRDLVRLGTPMHLATVDSTVYHGAGASDAQELGIATSIGLAYLRALTDAGMSIDDALSAVEFRFAVTAEQFPSIAKLRAARWIWDRVAQECGAAQTRRGQYQHAVTSAAMLTRRDPWVNMLRTTIACFSAAVGGADAITVLPFDSAIGRSDEFARRIARNTQAILHDESSLARVIDPAGGSWFVESLTDQLADKAWGVFTRIEQVGGALAALNSGAIGELLAQTEAHRADDVAHRQAPITGVSEFAFVDEAPVERESAPTPPHGLLPAIRYAQDFEALRDRADAAPQRLYVHLATVGQSSARRIRAGFAANLFQAAGVKCVTASVQDYAGATPVVCLCGSDEDYAAEGATAAASVRAAGARHIWLAGHAEIDGVDGTLFDGCDALDVLRTTLDVLGAPQ